MDTNHLAVLNSPGYEYSLVNPATTPNEVKIKIEVAFGYNYWIGSLVNNTWDHTQPNWIRNGSPGGIFEDTDVVNITDGAFNLALNAVATNLNLVGDLDIAGLYVTNTGTPFRAAGDGPADGDERSRVYCGQQARDDRSTAGATTGPGR